MSMNAIDGACSAFTRLRLSNKPLNVCTHCRYCFYCCCYLWQILRKMCAHMNFVVNFSRHVQHWLENYQAIQSKGTGQYGNMRTSPKEKKTPRIVCTDSADKFEIHTTWRATNVNANELIDAHLCNMNMSFCCSQGAFYSFGSVWFGLLLCVTVCISN